MHRKPALKPGLQAGAVPGQGVILVSEHDARILHGPLFERLVPLVDGSRTWEELVQTTPDPGGPMTVRYALELLEQRGFLVEAGAPADAREEAFWAGLGRERKQARQAMATGSVRLRALGTVDPLPMVQALGSSGLVLTEGEPCLELVLTDNYMSKDLVAWAASPQAQGAPWMLVKPYGLEPWVGPLFTASSGCYSCLLRRLRLNAHVLEFLRTQNGWPEPPATSVAAFPATLAAVCSLATLEAAKFLAGAQHALDNQLLSFDVRTWKTQVHRLVAHPSCPRCGSGPCAHPDPVRLASRPASTFDGNGHRTCRPEDTEARYQHLISPITGLVPGIHAMAGNGEAVQVYVCGPNPAFAAETLEDYKVGLRQSSGGKGAGPAQARASALAEALERYSAQFKGPEFQVHASFKELGADALHPNAVLGFSERQFRERDAWNARGSRYNSVPEPFDPDARIPWTPVWSLTAGREKWLPTQLLYLRGPDGPSPYLPFCRACSNGNAAGNNLEEAVLQGFLELVERDATAVWWYNRLRRPGVDLDSFGQGYLEALAAHYRSRGREIWALDLTHDLGIPAFAAASCLRETRGRILFGLGCSLDPTVALQRAFTEMNQMLVLDCNQDGGLLEDPEVLSWLDKATLDNHPYLAADPATPARRRSDFPLRASGDLLADLSFGRAQIEARGMELLVLDLTRPEVGLPVAKVLVPGLRHFWARFAPGRLFSVPVDMGWTEAPLAEEALNPTPIFF